MSHPRPTLLLTRPESQSRRFAAAFCARFGTDWPVVISPLSAPVFETFPDTAGWHGSLAFTSETGVAAYVRATGRRDMPAWCVGTRTADAARAAGLQATAGPGDGTGLARAMVAGGCTGPVWHIRGEDLAFDLATALNSAGIETHEVLSYRQVDCAPTAEALALMAGTAPVLLPLFSVRSADRAVSAFGRVRAPVDIAAISDAVAEAALMPARRTVIAAAPGATPMLDALALLIAADPAT